VPAATAIHMYVCGICYAVSLGICTSLQFNWQKLQYKIISINFGFIWLAYSLHYCSTHNKI